MLRATQDTATNHNLTCTGLSPSVAYLSRQVPVQLLLRYRSPTTPATPKRHWFGLFRVRSPLLAESQLFSSPIGTKMFQFPTFAPHCGTWSSTKWVSPFGNLRIKDRLHLPGAYRSLPRPSSPPRAKASTVRSCFSFSFREYRSYTRLLKCTLIYHFCELIVFCSFFNNQVNQSIRKSIHLLNHQILLLNTSKNT